MLLIFFIVFSINDLWVFIMLIAGIFVWIVVVSLFIVVSCSNFYGIIFSHVFLSFIYGFMIVMILWIIVIGIWISFLIVRIIGVIFYLGVRFIWF